MDLKRCRIEKRVTILKKNVFLISNVLREAGLRLCLQSKAIFVTFVFYVRLENTLLTL